MSKVKKYIGPEIKEIPHQWSVEPLGKCIKGTGKYGINESASEFHESLPRYLRITDVDDKGFLKHDDKKSVDADNYKKYILEEGDIVFARTGNTVGKSYLYKKEDGLLVFAGYLIKFQPKPEILIPEYLKYYTGTGFFWNWIRAISQRSGQPGVNSSEYKKMPILLPPTSEQADIISIIQSWDKALSTLEDLIQAKKRYKKGLMQQMLSGQKRFPEFVNSEDTFETKFGDYPVDWRYVKIRTFATELKDRKNEETTNHTVLSCTKYDGLVDSHEYFDRQVFSNDLSNYKVVKKGNFAYATNHIEEGSIGYNDWCETGLISPMYKVFRTDPEKVNDQFLYKLFKTEKYRHIFEINTNGTVNRRGSLGWRSFANIKVPLPPLKEQDKIAMVLKEAEKEIGLLEQELSVIKKQKKGLMQQLLTGKVRVNKEEDYQHAL